MEFESSRIESFAASPPVTHAPLAHAAMVAAEIVTQAAGDAIGPAHDLRLLEDALRNASSALEGGAAQSTAFTDGRISALLQSLAGVSTPQTQAALQDPKLVAALEHIMDASKMLATPPGMPSDLAAALARFAEAARAEGAATSAAASAEFATLVNEFGLERVVQALGTLAEASLAPAANLQTPNFALMAALLPQAVDDEAHPQSARRAGRGKRDEEASARARRERDLPEHDEGGRPYTLEERSKLARLWFDPRSGFAPEARLAIAAWRAFGLDLGRDRSGSHDFRDAAGEPWDIIADSDAARRERAIAASADANLILCDGNGTMTLRMRDS